MIKNEKNKDLANKKNKNLNTKCFFRLAYVLLITTLIMILTACEKKSTGSNNNEYSIVRSVDFQYATQVTIDFYEGGYAHINVADGNDYVLVPEGSSDNNLGFTTATIIHQNPNSVYESSSCVMDLLIQIDVLDKVKFCSTTAEDYTIDEVVNKINNKEIKYIGKYSAPDYETLLSENCDLAIENTMIYHTPKIKEELEEIGIPVFVERSSYEGDPLGRLEWIKVYGVLFDKEEEANTYFEEQSTKIRDVTEELEAKEAKTSENTKSVAVFYVSSNGYINVRKPGDYLVKMIEIAGGSYALDDLEIDEENALSTVNIDFEDFYQTAKDADILIYNGTIDGGINSVEDLLEKDELFADFEAVKNHEVYCTNLNIFQESSKVAEIIEDFYHILAEDGDETEFLFKLP